MFKLIRSISAAFLLLLLLSSTSLQAQDSDTDTPAPVTADAGVVTLRIDKMRELSRQIAERESRLEELEQRMDRGSGDALIRLQTHYGEIEAEKRRMEGIIELMVLGGLSLEGIEGQTEGEFNWQDELITVIEPVLNSLKNLTSKPRQSMELRTRIDNSENQLATIDQALERIAANRQAISVQTDDNATTLSVLDQLQAEWVDNREAVDQELLRAQTQLAQLKENPQSFSSLAWPATRRFLVGRGLTLVLVAISAALTWWLMRWLWNRSVLTLTNKHTRRNAPWFRILNYSFYLFTILACIVVALSVLYLREDGLLLALALLMLAFGALSLRNFLPAYVRETRLLLNLGAVREDERVMYQGLPWQVMNINIQSVLRNPALDGVLRLPLSELHDMVSRPIRDETWFPSRKGDFVLMPDGSFGRVLQQTPEMVELAVTGGMVQSVPTADFYATPFKNLSRDEAFGVSTTFGLDYGLQKLSLDAVPTALECAIRERLEREGYTAKLKSLMVELNEAGASSLDFIVFATFDSSVASDYFKLRRLLLQSCVDASNQQDWNIPFPQLVVHQANPPG